MYPNRKLSLLIILTVPLLISSMCKAAESFDDQVKAADQADQGQRKTKLKEFLKNEHDRNTKLQKTLNETKSLHEDAEKAALARAQELEASIGALKVHLDSQSEDHKKGINDLKAKMEDDRRQEAEKLKAEMHDKDIAMAALRQFPRMENVEFGTFPESASESLGKMYEQKANLIWREYYFGGVTHTADKILLPAISHEMQTLLTYKRQQYFKTPAELQMEELESRKSTHQEVLIMSGELDLEIKRRNLEEMEITKKSKGVIEDAQLQTINLENLIRYCSHVSGENKVCDQMEHMAEEIQLAQMQEAYKKRFGKPYVPKEDSKSKKK